MHPYGPILSKDLSKAIGKKSVKDYALTIRTGYLHDLILLAKNYGINLFLPGYIENAGPRKYLSAALVYGYDGRVVRYRKMFLTDYEEKVGLSYGTKPQVFTLDHVSFTVMLDNELLYPELARLNLLFSDFLVAGIPQNEPPKKYDSIVKTISRVNNSVTIVPGGRIFRSSTLYNSLPTMIIDGEGEILYRYNEDEQGLILIPTKWVKHGREKNFREIKRIYNLFKRYLSRWVGRSGDRESDHG